MSLEMYDEDEMFYDLLLHSVSQFTIAAKMGVSERVIYDNSPIFIQDAMRLFMDGEPSVVISGGGGGAVTMSKSLIMTLLWLTLMLWIFGHVCQAAGWYLGIDSDRCSSGKPNFGVDLRQFFIPLNLRVHVSALEPGNSYQHLYCEASRGIGSILSGQIMMNRVALRNPVIASIMGGGAVLLDRATVGYTKIPIRLLWQVVQVAQDPVKALSILVHNTQVSADGSVTDFATRVNESVVKIMDPKKGVLSPAAFQKANDQTQTIEHESQELVTRFAPSMTQRVTRSRAVKPSVKGGAGRRR